MLLLLDTEPPDLGGVPPRAAARGCARRDRRYRQHAHFQQRFHWEVAIKTALGRETFRVDAAPLRRGLLAAGYREMAVTGEHAIAVSRMSPLHRDPFDRILIAQAEVEGATLLTADEMVARCAGPVRLAR